MNCKKKKEKMDKILIKHNLYTKYDICFKFLN